MIYILIGLPIIILFFIVLIAVDVLLYAIAACVLLIIGLVLFAIFGADGLQSLFVFCALTIGAVIGGKFLLEKKRELDRIRRQLDSSIPPEDPHERYLWANRIGPYSDSND